MRLALSFFATDYTDDHGGIYLSENLCIYGKLDLRFLRDSIGVMDFGIYSHG